MGGATKFLMLLSTPFPLLSPRPAALRLRLRLRLPRPFSSSASSPYPSADAAAASFPPNPDPAPSYAPNPSPFSRAPGQQQPIEMKRGDWICHKCSFMNFARNMNCRECNEGRPQRQLTGAEWACPQCDFFNYGRNVSCLRCDCKRPGEAPVIGTVPDPGYGGRSNFEQILDRSYTDKSEIERKLAANDEKAERWFSKVPQLDDASDLSNAAADEDFPEIMPLRKGVNRFVVSTRKTPLERRLANSQYGSNMGNDGAADGYGPRSESFSGTGSDKTTDSSVSQSLDRILGRSQSSSAAGHANTGAGTRFNSSENRQRIPNERKDPDYVPFVPLPADMFSKSKNADGDMHQAPEEEYRSSLKAGELGNSASTISGSPTESKIDNESADASERWSKKVSEIDNITDISDEDFPDIMPMRKGENRFVVSKKKDRSLTSPQYKRRLAMEQANSSNFVPFVPFPPDYFAKKDKQTEAGSSTTQAATGDSAPVEQVHGVTEKLGETKSVDYNPRSVGSTPQNSERRMVNNELNGNGSNDGRMDTSYGVPATNEVRPSSSTLSPGNGFNDGRMGAAYRGPSTNPYQPSNNSTSYNKNSWSSGTEQKNSTYSGSSAPGTPPPAQYSQNAGESWKYSGKSLEGSAVKETDPLDMSEEAKTERWFKRVANIKDISELSQIPDSDFPEIMPMRKGVNRFVVSKRKTPLERRLTSPQYRRNLPTVSSEPEKDNK